MHHSHGSAPVYHEPEHRVPPRRRHRRVRPYVPRTAHTAAAEPPAPTLLRRVLDGLRLLPVQDEPRTPLVRHIDAELARTAVDRVPTEEIPVVTGEVRRR